MEQDFAEYASYPAPPSSSSSSSAAAASSMNAPVQSSSASPPSTKNMAGDGQFAAADSTKYDGSAPTAEVGVPAAVPPKPLKSTPLPMAWSVWHTPHFTAEQTSQHGSWEMANLALSRLLHTVNTVEMLWATVNAIPPSPSLPKGDAFGFFRAGVMPTAKDPIFQPHGGRLMMKLNPVVDSDDFVEFMLAAVLGERVAQETSTSNLVCGVRLMRKQTTHDLYTLMELWITDRRCLDSLRSACRRLAAESDLHSLDAPADNLVFKPFQVSATS